MPSDGPGLMTRTAPAARAFVGSPDLAVRVRRARNLALDHLLDTRTAEGCWRQPFDLSAISGAAYVVMLRTTGLIEQAGAARDEMMLVRHMLRQRNRDGGFFKFPGSPSSRAVTALVLTALRSSLGVVLPAHRPQRWFAPNPELGSELEQCIELAIGEAESFLRGSKSAGSWRFEGDVALPTSILRAFADPTRERPPVLPISPRLIALVHRSRLLAKAQQQFSALIHTVIPALSVIHAAAVKERRRVDGRRMPDAPETASEARSGRSTRELAELITSRQNRRGDWFYCTPYTMLNLMALRAAGVPADDPAITRAHRFLRESLYDDGLGGYAPSLMNSDIWDTSVATFTYLSMRGRAAGDPHILPAIEFLLENQGRDGGYGWGSGSLNDCDTDSTAAVLRALSGAVESATYQLESRIRSVMDRCREYLLSRQTRQGGFCVWAPTRIVVRPGPVGPVKGALLDVPSADLTARVLAALLHSGSTTSDPPIRRGLNYLVRMESPNGGWWCRWWAGYISGTAFVLDALSAAGIGWNRPEDARDRLTEELRSSMKRGIRFLLDHQNTDGGWGETIRADVDVAWAGRGRSRPAQTAAALYALLSCGYPATSGEIRRGFEWLLAAATRDGEWQDHQATFTILPGSLYYAHPMYSLTMLPAALSAFLRATDG